MDHVKTKLVALVLGLGLAGGGLIAADAIAAPTPPPGADRALTQAATPDTGEAADPLCPPGAEDDGDEAGDTDDIRDENGADDATEGDTDADGDESDEGENGEDDETGDAQPGQLSEGQDLLPRAGITVEQAVAAAQGAAQGTLGSVELEERDGALVFEVTVGDQEVFVDAADGAIVATEPRAGDDAEGCDDDAQATPGALDDGQDLLARATITVEQAVAAAQGAAQGTLGEVDLETRDGVLVFTVDIGDQDVHVDASTGTVVGTTAEETEEDED